MSEAAPDAPASKLNAQQRRRLREVWRSAGWPYQDMLEAELLAVGLLERVIDEQHRVLLRVTDAGVRELAQGVERHRRARDAHEGLVARVARQLQRDGRLVWRGLSLRAPLPQAVGEGGVAAEALVGRRWVMAMPDVFSIRQSSVEDFVEPQVHEIKVRRADLLADLARPDKAAAYAALCSRCWYVFPEGLAEADEIPSAYGVMVEAGGALQLRRAAPARSMKLPWTTWLALARRGAEAEDGGPAQRPLGEGLVAGGNSTDA